MSIETEDDFDRLSNQIFDVLVDADLSSPDCVALLMACVSLIIGQAPKKFRQSIVAAVNETMQRALERLP